MIVASMPAFHLDGLLDSVRTNVAAGVRIRFLLGLDAFISSYVLSSMAIFQHVCVSVRIFACVLSFVNASAPTRLYRSESVLLSTCGFGCVTGCLST